MSLSCSDGLWHVAAYLYGKPQELSILNQNDSFKVIGSLRNALTFHEITLCYCQKVLCPSIMLMLYAQI